MLSSHYASEVTTLWRYTNLLIIIIIIITTVNKTYRSTVHTTWWAKKRATDSWPQKTCQILTDLQFFHWKIP